MAPEIEPLARPKDIAREFGIQYAPLLKAIDSGRVPHIRIGRSRYVLRSQFRSFLEHEAEGRLKGVKAAQGKK